jgi:hypothetical protein
VQEVREKIMAKLESEENNSIIIDCVKQDEEQMELTVKVKSHSIVTNYSMLVERDDFKTFVTQIQYVYDSPKGAAELRQRFEEKKICFESDGLACDVDGVGEGRIIVSGGHSDNKNKGNECKFRFVADHTALMAFLWELSGMNT